MSTASASLKDLHQLHLQNQKVQDQLSCVPKQIRAREQLTARKREELEAARQAVLKLKKAADNANLQLRTNEAKIADLKVKLNSASSNREFDIFKSQIAADTMANSVLEDEILETLDKVDQAQREVKKLEEQVLAAEQEEKRIAADHAAAEPGLNKEAAELQLAIREAERALPGQAAEVYKRLVQAHGSSALAAIVNGVCTACYVSLSPQMNLDLRMGKICFCRSCGRIMYPGDEE